MHLTLVVNCVIAFLCEFVNLKSEKLSIQSQNCSLRIVRDYKFSG